MNKKKIIVSTLCSWLLLGQCAYAIPKTSTKQVTIPKGQVTLNDKDWKDKIEYTVGKDNIPFSYDKQYLYEDNDYKGYLNATKVIITPKEKIEKKYYTTESKQFNRTRTSTFGNQNDNNFNNNYYIDENGYKGNINRKNVNWTPNWVTNRVQWIVTDHTTEWLRNNPPSTIPYSYYDPQSGSTIQTTLNFIRTLNTRERRGYKFSTSSGNRYNYSNRNETLGFMSQNPTRYWGNTRYFSEAKPVAPDTYYGKEPDKENWEVVDWHWDEDRAYSADEMSSIPSIRQNLTYRNGSWWWSSETGVLNKYRKGVLIEYRKKTVMYKYIAQYGANVNLPNYIKDYNGTANYEGTLSKQIPHTYYTCNNWDVKIVYEGNIKLKNVLVSGSVVPNPSKQGGKITFNLSTKYYVDRIMIYPQGEVRRYINPYISLGVKSSLFATTTHNELLKLNIPETINKDGKRVKEPYEFLVVATRRSDGNKAECKLKLDVNGSILDKLKTVTLY